jgi:hypothetical protein
MKLIYKYIIPCLFLIQYLGIGAFAQYIIIFFIIIELLTNSSFKFSDADKILFFGVIILFLAKMLHLPFMVNLHLFRFYWGFTLLFFFILISDFKFNFILFFWITIIITTIESGLINTIVPYEMMRNVPGSHLEVLEFESKWMLYNRAYGLASSPTSSATILVLLLACIYKFQKEKYKDYYILITIFGLILFSSGTGFILFLVFLAMRYNLFKGRKLIFGLSILGAITIFIMGQSINQGGILMRLSGNYFETLFDLKGEQILEVFSKIGNSIFEIFVGAKYDFVEETRVMSDFGWIDFVECYGILGPFLFISYIFMKRIFFFAPILLVVFGYFHYPAIGSIPGQILFAAILVNCSRLQINNEAKESKVVLI